MVNFAIIGCGHIAKRHAEQCVKMGRLIAVCDIEWQKAVDFSAIYGARAYTAIEELLEKEMEVDIVAVCTPNGWHASHSIQALRAGCHVICEKPMAICITDCEHMLTEAGKAHKHLFIVKQNRFNPPVAAVKEMLDKHELGQVFSVQLNCCWHRGDGYYRDSWHGTKDLDGGILYTQFSHFIDLLQWMVGDVSEALAFSGNLAHQLTTKIEDTIVACLQFENGVLGSLHCTTNSHKKNMEGSLTIIAEKGTVKIGGEYLNKLEYQETEKDRIGVLSPGNLPNDYGTYQGSMSNHDKLYQHVVDVIANGSLNQFDAQSGLRTVRIVEKIYAAAR